jgi:hypothetical protein
MPKNPKALLALSALLVALGFVLRLPAFEYDGPLGHPQWDRKDNSAQDAFNHHAFDAFAYTDILSLYYRDGLQDSPRPYLDVRNEYPPGMAFTSWILSILPGPRSYFVANYLLLLACVLLCVRILQRSPGARPWILALSPALVFDLGINWDILAIASLLAALQAFRERRLVASSLLFALSFWTKVYPAFFLPALGLSLLLQGGLRPALRFAVPFVAASALVTLVLWLVFGEGAWFFIGYQTIRDPELNLWTWIPSIRGGRLNSLISLLTLAGLAATLVPLWLRRRESDLARRAEWAGFALLVWSFFSGKVYSPQYGLWPIALLAFLGAPTFSVAAMWSIDVVYFFTSFITLGLIGWGDAVGWFAGHILHPSAMAREAVLLGLAGWGAILAGRRRSVAEPAAEPARVASAA